MRSESHGNRVQFLLDGTEYFAALHQLLDDVERARDPQRSYVKLAFWKASSDVLLGRARVRLVDKLRAVADAGVPVRVILWRLGSVESYAWQQHWNTSNDFLQAIGGANVETYYEQYRGWPFGRVASCTSQHQKIVIGCVDGEKRVLVGGLNMEPQYQDNVEHGVDYPLQDLANVPADEQKHNWHDAGIELAGPAVHDIEGEWDRRWAKSGRPALRLPTVPRRAGDTSLIVATTNSEAWSSIFSSARETDIRRTLLAEIARAQHYVYLESFVVFDPELVQALVRRLQQHPTLAVIIVVPRPDAVHDAKNDYLCYTTFLQLAFVSCAAIAPATTLGAPALRRISGSPTAPQGTTATGGKITLTNINAFTGGVRLNSPMRRTGGGAVPIYIHSKVAIIDDEVAVVGSANWNYRSMEYDGELSVFVRDAVVARQVRRRVFSHFGMTAAAGTLRGQVGAAWNVQAKTSDTPGDVPARNVFIRQLDIADFLRQAPTGIGKIWTML